MDNLGLRIKRGLPIPGVGIFPKWFWIFEGAVSANSFDYFNYFKIFFAQELQTVGPISDRMYVLSKYIDDKVSLINMLVYHSSAIDY